MWEENVHQAQSWLEALIAHHLARPTARSLTREMRLNVFLSALWGIRATDRLLPGEDNPLPDRLIRSALGRGAGAHEHGAALAGDLRAARRALDQPIPIRRPGDHPQLPDLTLARLVWNLPDWLTAESLKDQIRVLDSYPHDPDNQARAFAELLRAAAPISHLEHLALVLRALQSASTDDDRFDGPRYLGWLDGLLRAHESLEIRPAWFDRNLVETVLGAGAPWGRDIPPGVDAVWARLLADRDIAPRGAGVGDIGTVPAGGPARAPGQAPGLAAELAPGMARGLAHDPAPALAVHPDPEPDPVLSPPPDRGADPEPAGTAPDDL